MCTMISIEYNNQISFPLCKGVGVGNFGKVGFGVGNFTSDTTTLACYDAYTLS